MQNNNKIQRLWIFSCFKNRFTIFLFFWKGNREKSGRKRRVTYLGFLEKSKRGTVLDLLPSNCDCQHCPWGFVMLSFVIDEYEQEPCRLPNSQQHYTCRFRFMFCRFGTILYFKKINFFFQTTL